MKRRILHIFAQPNPASEQFERAIGWRQWESCVAPDCYAGLAEIVRQGAGEFLAVLVWLDGLGAAEREFFHLASRRFRSLPLFVYATAAAQVDVREALAAGAAAEVSPPSLMQLLQPAMPPVAEDARAGAGEADVTCGSAAGEAASAAAAQPEPEVTTARPAGMNAFEQGLAGAPSRTRLEPAGLPGGPPPDPEARALLTDEELQALLGTEEEQQEQTGQHSRPAE